MIPSIRSLSELMAITESRCRKMNYSESNEFHFSPFDSGQRKRYIRSQDKKPIVLPELPKKIYNKLKNNKKFISRFIDDLDYNNQIPSSYELTLLARQSKINQKDAA